MRTRRSKTSSVKPKETTSSSTINKCHLLTLPPELLLNIASFLIDTESPNINFDLTLFRKTDFTPLIPLSSSHSGLRQACISTGLFRQLYPKTPLVIDLEKFIYRFVSSYAAGLTSLLVDLGNRDVYPLCTHIMARAPELNELSLTGEMASLDQSILIDREFLNGFSQFRGKSLVFRNAIFTVTSIPVLATLAGDNVTSIFFDTSQFLFKRTDYKIIRLPLFPNLKKIKFLDASLIDSSFRRDTVEQFALLMMMHCKLTHFELSCGIGLSSRKSEVPFEGASDLSTVPTQSQFIVRRELFSKLFHYSLDSLRVFVDHDSELENSVACDKGLWKHASTFLFRQMAILVFTINDADTLIRPSSPERENHVWNFVRSPPPVSPPSIIPIHLHIYIYTCFPNLS